jgi:hypothetical protein
MLIQEAKMSHFAKVENGVVTEVIVAEQDFVDTLDGTWIQTSYSTYGGKHVDDEGNDDGGVPLRKNYAGIGFTYDADRDAFIPPQPYPYWSLNDDTCLWEAPIAQPTLTYEEFTAGKWYEWDDDIYQDDNTQGWVLVDVSL